MQTKESILQACTIHGTTVKLPSGQLDRKLYQDVAKAIELIGGKWKGGKVAGFEFAEDPTELLEQIANGDQRNLKKEYQYFSTPLFLAEVLVEEAFLKPEHKILEPSAGTGSILKAILKKLPDKRRIDCCELMPTNKTILQRDYSGIASIMADDFLSLDHQFKDYYDRIIANPPFSKNQDIDHIRKMYECLAPGGRMVTIASKHWELSTNKKETDFREWLSEMKVVVQPIAPGSFKESGTMVGMNILIIDKPLPKEQPVQTSNESKPSSMDKYLSRDVNYQKHSTVNHNAMKYRLLSDIQNLINEATKTPLNNGSNGETLFSEWIKDAKTPKQIADKTAEFIQIGNTENTGVNANGYIEFCDNTTGAIYKVPDASALPGLILQIKKLWGDGSTHNPSAGGNPDNYGKSYRNCIQLAVKQKREEVESSPQKRKEFIEWLNKGNTGDILYQCSNYILFTNKPKQVPAPIPLPREAESAPIPLPLPKQDLAPQPSTGRKPIPRKVPLPTGIMIIEYSEKAIAVFGNTKPHKEKLLELHGSFCKHLKYQNEPTPGWVFSKKRESAIRQLFAS